jgi:uncharacterized protein YbaP (TraB family)
MKTIKAICILFAMTLMFSCRAQQPDSLKLPHNKDDNSLLWEISGKGLKKPSYLFGTFHLLCKDDIHVSANLQQAIKNADEVYFEMDLDDPANTLGAMFYMNMKDKTLKDLYTPAEYDKVAAFFKDSLKMSLNFFGKMKPMMLEALLYPRMMPCKTPSGVEMELMSYAKKQKKEIKGFETMEFQSSVFDSIPYDVQAKALLRDIDSSGSAKVYFTKMMDIYISQNTEGLTKLMADTAFSSGENNDALLKNRNTNWVRQLDTILKQKNIFIGVGAAHLLGDVGLIALLRKEGYTVTPLLNK